MPPEDEGLPATLARPNGVSYLFIPAVDLQLSADFYAAVFHWNIRERDSTHPSFDDGTGHVSGAFTTDQVPSREPGLLPYIYVENIDTTVTQITHHGGKIVKPVYPEGNLWVSTFHDPAGNVLGIWHYGPRT